MPHPHRKNLLTSVQMAHFVATGAFRMDAVVPDEMNQQALDVLAGRHPRRPVRHAAVGGVHRQRVRPSGWCSCPRSPARSTAWSARSRPSTTTPCTSARRTRARRRTCTVTRSSTSATDAFDVQLMYYPQEVTLEMGGTLSVPGSHLRRTNESDTGRYQNLRGQTRLTCPAGTVVFLHHGIWHGGRKNDSAIDRYMFKIRFNPTVRQVRLWDLEDLYDEQVARRAQADVPLVRERDRPAGDLQPGQALAGADRRRHLRPRLLGHPRLEPPAARDLPAQHEPARREEGRLMTTTAPDTTAAGTTVRQQVLVLYLASSALDARRRRLVDVRRHRRDLADDRRQRRPAVRDGPRRAEGRLAPVPGRAAAAAAARSRVRRVVPQARVLLREARHGLTQLDPELVQSECLHLQRAVGDEFDLVAGGFAVEVDVQADVGEAGEDRELTPVDEEPQGEGSIGGDRYVVAVELSCFDVVDEVVAAETECERPGREAARSKVASSSKVRPDPSDVPPGANNVGPQATLTRARS